MILIVTPARSSCQKHRATSLKSGGRDVVCGDVVNSKSDWSGKIGQPEQYPATTRQETSEVSNVEDDSLEVLLGPPGRASVAPIR